MLLYLHDIQLFHVKSGKYISIVPDHLARDERENIQVSLDPHGSAFSWLNLLPRYKIDREGDRILSNTEVVLKVAERSNEFIHCSEKSPPAGCCHEVNCSLETTPWRLSLFHSMDSSDSQFILASQVVYLHDPETHSNVTVISKKNIETDAIEDFVAIKPVSIGGKFDSSDLWVIESKKLTRGGSVRWRKDHIRFRNLNSGKYLCMSNSPSRNLNDADDTFPMNLCISPSTPGTLFSLHELYSSSTHLTDGKAMQMSHGSYWIGRGDYTDHTYSCFGSPEISKGMNLLIHKYTENNKVSFEPEGITSDPLDVFVGVAARNFLKKYMDQLNVPTSKSSSLSFDDLWHNINSLDIDLFLSVIGRVIRFVNGYPISSVANTLVFKPMESLRLHRQKMICDQGSLAIVMILIENFIPISTELSMVGISTSKSISLTDKRKNAMIIGNKIIESCLNFTYNAIRQNPSNQMFVADMMHILLSHVGSQPLAAKCITEMLSSNMELQQQKISYREISLFTEKLRTSRMNCMYLHLLKACCSCHGSGVIGNQFDVAELFFRDYNDVVISVHCDFSQRRLVTWDPNNCGLYIPHPDSILSTSSTMFGASLVTSGLPSLSLSWTTKFVDFSPLGLFGKLSITIDELFDAPEKSKYEKQTNTLLHDKKLAVATYFSAEMSLVAEMCLERNYSAMKRAEQLFPYDVLVTLIKLNIDENLKAGAVQLLLRLYVDRNPQVVSCLPSLTRKFKTKVSHGVNLPTVERSRVNHFALLQQLISEDIKEMKGGHWKEVSLCFMQLLNKLVMFQFYGSEEKLKDVIEPLINALDHRSTTPGTTAESSDIVFPNARKKRSNSIGGGKKIQPELKEDVNSATDDDDTNSKDNSRSNSDLNLSQSWQSKMLIFLDSVLVLVLVVLLVFVAIGVTLAQTLSGQEGHAFNVFDFVIMLIFASEIALRYYCHVFVHKSYSAFFYNILNCIDVSVVLIDITLLGVPSSSASSEAKYTKGLRAVRLIRLVRVFRAARLVEKMTSATKTVFAWKMPTRYSSTSSRDLETMVEAMNVLVNVQLILEDRCVSLLLEGFQKWYAGLDARKPEDIFEDVLLKSKELSLGIQNFNDIFLDNIMYESSDLVQVALDLMMTHHTLRATLLSNIQKVQLIVSPKSIEQHDSVREMLYKLERNVEANEIWGHLFSAEDNAIDAETKVILTDLTNICKERRVVFEFDLDFQPVASAQDLLRNLGFCELAVKMRRLLTCGNKEAQSAIVKNNIAIFSICNQLMYWFLYDNNTNQNIIFRDIQFFFDTLDMDIGSHLVIQALFSNNEDLMRACPKKLILEFTDKVCTCGQFPQYLTLHGSITNTRGKNIIENQYEIVKQLISPARVQRLVSFFCPITHEDYKRKVELMTPFLGKKHVAVEDLPFELGYHLEFLRVLSGCTVGRSNLNTIEAKVQSLYDYVDMLDAILDPRSILIVKTRLTLFFFNAMIDVEVVIPGIAHSARMWKLLESFESVFATALLDLKLICQMGWEKSGVDRQNIDHMLACALVTGGFFQCLFDATKIRGESTSTSDDRVQKTIGEVNALIESLYIKIKRIVDFKSPVFDNSHIGYLEDCLDGLNKSSGTSLKHTPSEEPDGNMVADISIVTTDDFTEQNAVLHKLRDFCSSLVHSPSLQAYLEFESQDFIREIEKLPYLCDNCITDMQFEPLICKLVNHIRDRLVIKGESKRLDPRCTKTSNWIIRCFRGLIEKKWGMTIYERDDEGGEKEDEASSEIVAALNRCGVTTLCLDLISVGIDSDLLLECVKLCVALLFREGGSLSVQETIYNHLDKTKSDSFFLQMRSSIQKMVSWHEWGDIITLDDDTDPSLPEDVIVVRFLQLMCEGHYKPNQDLLRDQTTNSASINLLDDFIMYLNAISRIPCRTSTAAAIQLSATILEVIQGPCELNQEHFILQTELMETLNRLLRALPVGDCVDEEEFELKKTCIDIFQGLLEGRGGSSSIYERVLSVVHLDIIQMLSTPGESCINGQDNNLATLRTESSVLLKVLCDYKPSIQKELEMTSGDVIQGNSVIGNMCGEVACVEVLWRGELQRRFFHVPQICLDLAKPSKDAFVESVDRSSAENKLQDFLFRSHELYGEIRHQQILKEWKVSGLFSRANQNTATWISFFLAVVINFLLLSYYSAENGEPNLPPQVRIITDTLNLIQLFFSLFTLILFLVVRVPVKYQTNLAAGYSQISTIFYTATDGLTLYYFIYFIICLLAINLSDTFLTFLLLDVVVKNSTTRDVLNAVIYPRRQLGMTILLGVFVVYIFSFVIVSASPFIL